MKKYVLILANSIKHDPNRCVAGREIIQQDDKTAWGPWVRPVTSGHEGALPPLQRKYADASELKPLDLVEVEVGTNLNDPLQPENWMLGASPAWVKIGVADFESIKGAVEQPPHLWLDPATKADRATPGFLESLADRRSLYLIEPPNLTAVVETRTWEGRSTKKLRATFTYANRYYDLSLLDPVMRNRFLPNYNVPDTQVRLRSGSLVCVSLTPIHRATGCHFKVVATVFEPPA